MNEMELFVRINNTICESDSANISTSVYVYLYFIVMKTSKNSEIKPNQCHQHHCHHNYLHYLLLKANVMYSFGK